jgi:hypothetical protein
VYNDAGAICEDEIDGKLAVSQTGSVTVGATGVYKITYTCVNKRGYSARPAERTVIVRDTTCPICHVNGDAATVEAEFPYADKGAFFTDSVDGRINTNIKVISNVNIKKVGVYYVTYRAEDKSGNWNDGKCKGANTCRRKVSVIDTLKPVIGLKFSNKYIHVSDHSDLSQSDNPHANPAGSYFSLMAESGSASTFSIAGVVACAVGIGFFVSNLRAAKQSEQVPV